MCIVIFFCKQKTGYELRISDWSSDVCSSDLKWPQFFRLRYLETPTDFAALAEKKPQRYIQPPGSGLCAYFPRNLSDGQTWAKIMADPDVQIGRASCRERVCRYV